MTWDPELDELRRRTELAARMGGAERVERQHASGRLDVRQRVARLFDEGSFHETGGLAGKGTYGDDGELTDFLPANMVVGQGRIDGRRAVLQGDDFTVRGGAADAAIWQATGDRCPPAASATGSVNAPTACQPPIGVDTTSATIIDSASPSMPSSPSVLDTRCPSTI